MSDSEAREKSMRLVADVRRLYGLDAANAGAREKTTTAQRAPVGGRIAGDAAGRGEIPGRQITTSPTRPRVPTEEAARGRYTASQTDETMDQTYMVIATSTRLAAKHGRAEVDVRGMLREEIPRQFAGGADDFNDALLRAERQVDADVKEGRR